MSVLDLYVARLVSRRRASSPEAARALRSFSIWWYGLAATTAVGALRELLAALGVIERTPHATLTYAIIPILVVALWGLVDYLVYVHTGSARWRHAILVSHLVIGACLFGLVVYLHPLGATVADWEAPVVYEKSLSGPLLGIALVLLLGPVLFASLGYFSLAFRTRDAFARRRILTVSGAFLAWFGSAALASALRLDERAWWPLAADAIAVAATLVVLLAFRAGPRGARA